MKPGIKTIIAGCLTLLFGVFVPLLFLFPMIFSHEHETQFKVPGDVEVMLKEPGRYYLWNDYQTVYAGKSYNQSRNIPDGLEIHIRDADGHELQFISSLSASATYDGSAKNSIGYVLIQNPGKVTIQVSGGKEDRIFSFSSFNILKDFFYIAAGVGLSMLIGLSGFGLIIWGIVKLARGNPTPKEPSP